MCLEVSEPESARPETQPAPAAIAWKPRSKLRADLAARESSLVGALSASRRNVYRKTARRTLVLKPLPNAARTLCLYAGRFNSKQYASGTCGDRKPHMRSICAVPACVKLDTHVTSE